MCTRLYCSLIFYPLALVLEVLAVIAMVSGHSWQGVGLSVLGGHMLLWQIIWAFFTPRPADIAFTACCLCSACLVMAVIIGSFSMVVTNWLIIGSVLMLFVGRGAAAACEYLSRRKAEPATA